MIFNPRSWRKTLLEFAIDFEERQAPEQYLPNAVGNAAVSGLQTCTYACFVDLRNEVDALIYKYRDWLLDSFARDEHFGSPACFFTALRYEALGLAGWLCENRSTKKYYEKTLPLYQQTWLQTGTSDVDIWENYAADYLRNCVLAHAYHQGTAFCEKIGKSMPDNAENIANEAELGYWLCHKALTSTTRDAATLEAAARVFALRLENDWLEHGQVLKAAAWLKAVYWEGMITATPEKTLFMAYQFMPHVSWSP